MLDKKKCIYFFVFARLKFTWIFTVDYMLVSFRGKNTLCAKKKKRKKTR